MDVPQSVVEGLTLLSDALEDPATDLQAVLSVLTDDLVAAIPLFLGLTVALQVDEYPVIVNTLDVGDAAAVRASLMLPLLPPGATASTGSVVFYSGTAGAFVAMADDARWIFNLDGQPVLDRHLPSCAALTEPVGVHGLTRLSDFHQAVGVLIEDGLTPQDARTELRRRATSNRQTLPEAARHLLSTRFE